MAVANLNRYDAIVVGAGFAGLSAAVRLARRGALVMVLEARSRLGGRATAFQDRETGELVDNGQHVLLGCYTETFSFLKEIDALDGVALQPQLALTMIDRRGRQSRLSCPSSLPSPYHLLAGVLDWSAMGWKDRFAIFRMRTPLKLARRELAAGATRVAASPGETAENWLIRNGQTDRLREMLWDPLALAALNQSAREAAAPPFARVLAEMFGSDPKAAAIGLPTRPLHMMYAEPARLYIESHGGAVRTGAPAKIRVDEGSVASVSSGEDEWRAPVVVSAVPWYALGDLISGSSRALAPTLERARATASSPIVTVNLWLDRALFDEPFIGLPGRRMQWVFDKRAVFGGEAAHLSLVSSGASSIAALGNDELIRLAFEEIVDAFPRARTVRLLRGTVIREPHATFSLAPGQPARPDTITPVRGLFLAGDWIATGLPATIESAVRSGHRAADAAAQLSH